MKTVRNGIVINADKARTLRFTHGGRALFEAEARKLLALKEDNNAGIMQILPAMWSRADIQALAIRAALWHEDKDLDTDAAYGIIDAYIDKGGSVDELGLAIQEALKVAFDPSSVAFWKKSLEKFKKIQEMQRTAADMETETALKKAEENLKSLMSLPVPTISESANSD